MRIIPAVCVPVLLLLAVLRDSIVVADEPLVEALMEGVNLIDAIDEFHAWFRRGYGPTACPVELAAARDGMRLGVYATRDIAAESVYLSIPESLCMSDKTIFPTPGIGPAIQRLLQRTGNRLQPQQLSLNLFLTHQRFVARHRSFFHPYIQLLPSEHDIPTHFTDAQLNTLVGTLIPAKARTLLHRHKDEYALLKSIISADASLRSDFPLHTFTLEHYIWAQSILNTRMIWWDGVPHLVPMLDMINCREGTDNPHRVHSTSIGPTGRADTKAPWSFAKGQQIFENYGQPNPTYYLYHGFVLMPNSHDCAQVELTSVKWKSISQVHRRALERLGLNSKREFCFSIRSRTWSDAITVARVISMTEQEVVKLVQPPTTFQSRINEGRALTLVKKSIEVTLAMFLNETELKSRLSVAGLDDDSMQFRKSMVIAFLESQQTILRDVLSVIERHIRPLRKQREVSSGSEEL